MWRACKKLFFSSFARASVGVGGNNAMGDALPNLDSTTMQSFIQEIGQISSTNNFSKPTWES